MVKVKQLILIISYLVLSVSSLAVFSKDPTRPLTYNQPVREEPIVSNQEQILTAIITRKSYKVAIINGKLYRDNDLYNGNRIIQIDNDSVLIKSIEGDYRLTLIPKIKK